MTARLRDMTFATSKFSGFFGMATGVIVAQYALLLSDIVLAGRVLGETALGSFALLMPVFGLASFCAFAIADGTARACAEANGMFERERANRLAGRGLVASVAVGAALALALSLLTGPYLSYMAPGSEAAEMAAGFVRWLPLAVAVGSVDLMLVHIVHSYGGVRDCFVSGIAQILVNIVASYGLCEGLWGLPAMGMSGIVFGTVVSLTVGILLLLPAVVQGRGGLRFAFRTGPESPSVIFAGGGGASAELFHALLFVVVARFLVVRYGEEALPVATAVFCIIRLSVCFRGTGVALRMLEPLYFGDGNRRAVTRLARFAVFVSLSESALLTVILLAAPELVVSMLGIDDPELVVSTVRAIRLTVVGLAGYAITCPLCVHYGCTGSRSRGLALSVLAFFGAPMALLFVFGALYGMDGVFLAVAVGPLVPLAAFMFMFRRRTEGFSSRMWSTTLEDGNNAARILEAVREELRGKCSGASASRATDVLMLALKHLYERNGAGCRVEVTLLFGKENVELVVRDDGACVALDNLGLPVVHVPSGCFNRNVFTVPLGASSRALSTRRDGGRYAVLRGRDVPKEDVEAIIALDRESFAEAYQVAPEQDIALFEANRENGLVVKDSKTGEVVAYSMLLPVREEVYERILTGKFVDTALTPDMVLPLDRPGIYRMYFASIVIHPKHRGASLLLTMFNAMVEDFIALAERGIFGASLAADVVSQDGEKFAKLFGLVELRKTDHASSIYEVSGLPPEFRVTTPATERLVGLYWEKFVQEKLKS